MTTLRQEMSSPCSVGIGLRESTDAACHVVSHNPTRSRAAQPFATTGPLAAVGRCLVGLGLVLLLVPAGGPPAWALNDAQQLVVGAWKLVNQSYVDPSQLEEMGWRRLRQKTLEQPIQRSSEAYDAIEAMLEPLGDSYTRMLRPSEYAALRSNTKGTVCGVGLQLALGDEEAQIVVIAPLDGSPAAEAGIASGSTVLQVNGESTKALGLDRTAALLRGPSGSEVLIKLSDPDGKLREVNLKRRSVNLQPVRKRVLHSDHHTLGYLRITQFSESVPQQVRETLEELGRDESIEGLILDLRNNSGGLVSAGVSVANTLLDGEVIVETKDRGGIPTRQQAAPGWLYDGPILVMVNRGTASASEILGGALQDNGRAILVGGRTFGKGLIQTLIPLGDGSGLAVTVARYLTPAGHNIQGAGITPDIPLDPPEPLNPGGAVDTWLEQAQQLLAAELESGTADRQV